MSDKNAEMRRMIAFNLKNKLASLREKQARLTIELEAGFTVEKFRQINLVEYSIECTQNRLEGKFTLRQLDMGITVGGPVPIKYK